MKRKMNKKLTAKMDDACKPKEVDWYYRAIDGKMKN